MADSKFLYIKGSRVQVYKTLPSNNIGDDGDIILSQIQGRGVFLCSKVNGRWHVSTKMEELRKIEKTSIKDLKTDRLKVGTTTITKDEYDVSVGDFTIDTGGDLLLTPNVDIKSSSPLKIKEAAAAVADTTAYGQLWVKTATPNELYFTTDAGNDIQLTSGTTAAFVGDITSVVAGDGLTGGGTTGDVTLTISVDDSTIETNSDALRIKDDGVTYSKIQNVTATNRILGRDSAGAGVIEEITPANLRTMINVADGAEANVSGNSGNSAIYDNSGTPTLKSGITQGEMQTAIGGVYTDTQLTDEQVQDKVGAMFSSNTETLITATYQDGDGTVDLVVDNDLSNYDNSSSGFITATLTTEQVQDIVGAMFSSNTETRISATYQDGDGTIDLAVDDMTADTNTNQLTTFNIGVDNNTNSTTIAHGETLTFTGGTGISTQTTADGEVTISCGVVNTNLSTEQVQDIVGAMFTSNTETRVAATYQDGDGTIDLVVDDMTADTNTTYTGGTNLTLDGTTFNVDDAFLKNNANDTTSGVLTAHSFVAGSSLYADQNMQYDGDDVINFASNGVVDFPNHTYFYEKAAAAADITARGQLWVKNDTPNNLYFTDDSGQDIAITNNGSLAGGGGASALNDLSDVTYSSGDLTISSLDKIISGALTFDMSGNIVFDFGSAGHDLFQIKADGSANAIQMGGENGNYSVISMFEEGGTSTDDYFRIYVEASGATEITTEDNAGADGHLKIQPDGNLILSPISGIMKFYDGNNASDYSQFSVGTHGSLTVATVDAAAANAHLTLDVDGDITLDADGGDIYFKDNGTLLGTINQGGFVVDVTEYGNGSIMEDGSEVLYFADGKVSLDYSFFIGEQASAQADVAGRGQLWVKSDTPNNLYFTNDAGNDVQITNGASLAGGGGGGSNFVTDDADDTMAGTLTIDKNSTETTPGFIRGIQIDLDHTGNTAGGGSMLTYGLDIAVNDDTGTHIGGHYPHGINNVVDSNTTGFSASLGLTQFISGGDSNTGIYQKVDDGGIDLIFVSSANTGDYFTLATTTNGATTLATRDVDAALAHLTLDADGDITLDAASGNIYVKDNGGNYTPGSDYEIATKKYVDDNAGGGGGGGGTDTWSPQWSMRWYTRYGYYYYPHTIYGANYYNWSSASTSALTSWTDDRNPCIVVPKDMTIKSYHLYGNYNSAQTIVLCIKKGTPSYGSAGNTSLSTLGSEQTLVVGTASINVKLEETGLSVSLSAGDIIIPTLRRTTTSTSSYYMFEGVLNIIGEYS